MSHRPGPPPPRTGSGDLYEFIPRDAFTKLTHEDALFFEHFDFRDKKQWMAENWTISLYITAAYLGLIFLGQLFMKNRAPYDLRRLLTAWNVLLATFSIAATLRTFPELIRILTLVTEKTEKSNF